MNTVPFSLLYRAPMVIMMTVILIHTRGYMQGVIPVQPDCRYSVSNLQIVSLGGEMKYIPVGMIGMLVDK